MARSARFAKSRNLIPLQTHFSRRRPPKLRGAGSFRGRAALVTSPLIERGVGLDRQVVEGEVGDRKRVDLVEGLLPARLGLGREVVHQVDREIVKTSVVGLEMASLAFLAAWPRSRKVRERSSSDWTPRLIRLIPRQRALQRAPCLHLPGWPRSVISQSSAKASLHF